MPPPLLRMTTNGGDDERREMNRPEDAAFAEAVSPATGGMDSQTRFKLQYDAAKRSTLIAYLLWFFLGPCGVHRFYLKRYMSGLALLLLTAVGGALTVILVGYVFLAIATIWWVIDLFLIPEMVRDYNTEVIATLR